MTKQRIIFNRFEGGLSTDPKTGIAHSQAYVQALDFRKNPSQLSVLPGLIKESGAVVTDLIQNFVMVPDGSIYSLGDTGNFYKRSTAGVWTLIGNVSTAAYGMDYRRDSDIIYICGTTTVHTYGPTLGTPLLTANKYGSSVDTANTVLFGGLNINPNQSGSGFNYAPPLSITENTINSRYLQMAIEPLQKISIYVQSKGTGDWTVTLHDGLNNLLGSVTVSNSNLMNNTFNDFVFSSPIRIYVSPNARTYHVHVTSTVADGFLTTTANGDLSGSDIQVYANRLIATTNGLHPMTRFLQYEVIGNSNYLSVWQPISEPPTNSEWQRHRIFLPNEYEVCGLAVFNEYLAIALQQVSTNTTSNPQEGVIAFWDGLSTLTTPTYFVKIPEGTPQSIREYKNSLYYYADGAWYRIDSPSSQPIKIRTFPGSDTEYSGASVPITINPYAATVRRGILLTAYPSTTTSTSINYGVYSWGHIDRSLAESFGYNYLISTGSQNYSVSNNLAIGAIRNFGDIFLVSWRDTGMYGVDSVTNASAPATISSWNSLVVDNGIPTKEKTAIFLKVILINFPSDASIVLKYKLNRGNWVTSSPYTAANTPDNVCRFDMVSPSRYKEAQVGFDLTSGTTAPIVMGVVMAYDDNVEETIS